MRVLISGMLICLCSWLALAAGAGNMGLQRSVAVGPLTLLERPLALVLVAAVSFGVAFILALRLRAGNPWGLVLVVLLGDLLAATVLAPLAVGELEPWHAPLVFLPLTVVGVQPVAALAGVLIGRRLAAR